MVNYKAVRKNPDGLDPYRKKKFYRDAPHYFWDEPYLYKKEYLVCLGDVYPRQM